MYNLQVIDASDPQIPYLEQAFARIAECLGSGFVPYLPLVIPSAIERATNDAEVSFSDGTQAMKFQVTFKGESNIDGWEMYSLDVTPC